MRRPEHTPAHSRPTPTNHAIQPTQGPSVDPGLEAQLAAAKAETRKLTTERDILRQAAKYFAGETNW